MYKRRGILHSFEYHLWAIQKPSSSRSEVTSPPIDDFRTTRTWLRNNLYLASEQPLLCSQGRLQTGRQCQMSDSVYDGFSRPDYLHGAFPDGWTSKKVRSVWTLEPHPQVQRNLFWWTIRLDWSIWGYRLHLPLCIWKDSRRLWYVSLETVKDAQRGPIIFLMDFTIMSKIDTSVGDIMRTTSKLKTDYIGKQQRDSKKH